MSCTTCAARQHCAGQHHGARCNPLVADTVTQSSVESIHGAQQLTMCWCLGCSAHCYWQLPGADTDGADGSAGQCFALTSGFASCIAAALSLVGWACSGSALLIDSTCSTQYMQALGFALPNQVRCLASNEFSQGMVSNATSAVHTACLHAGVPCMLQGTASYTCSQQQLSQAHLHQERQSACRLSHQPLLSQHPPQCLRVVLQPCLQRQ